MYILKKRVQRYYFLRTQQNKMHKISAFVHKLRDLCNKEAVKIWCYSNKNGFSSHLFVSFSYLCSDFIN